MLLSRNQSLILLTQLKFLLLQLRQLPFIRSFLLEKLLAKRSVFRLQTLHNLDVLALQFLSDALNLERGRADNLLLQPFLLKQGGKF